MNISFRTLSENCSHQGMIKEGRRWCGKGAKCWADWHLCEKSECPLLGEDKRIMPQVDGQISLMEWMEETS